MGSSHLLKYIVFLFQIGNLNMDPTKKTLENQAHQSTKLPYFHGFWMQDQFSFWYHHHDSTEKPDQNNAIVDSISGAKKR